MKLFSVNIMYFVLEIFISRYFDVICETVLNEISKYLIFNIYNKIYVLVY